MIVYRITPKKYSKDLTGTGASQYGGRWNNKGTSVLYTGTTLEISLLELIVHVPPMMIPKLDSVSIKIPNNSIAEIKANKLPVNWCDYPAPSVLAEIGEEWVKSNKSLALKVPSSILPSAFNIILNCNHTDFYKVKIIKIEDFRYDPRLNS